MEIGLGLEKALELLAVFASRQTADRKVAKKAKHHSYEGEMSSKVISSFQNGKFMHCHISSSENIAAKAFSIGGRSVSN